MYLATETLVLYLVNGATVNKPYVLVSELHPRDPVDGLDVVLDRLPQR